MEVFFRAAFYLITGIALVGACTWYVQSLVQAVTGRGEVVIAPFEVVGSANGKDRGVALAHMLHARLREIERDLRVSQRELTSAHGAVPAGPTPGASGSQGSAGAASANRTADAISMPQLLTQPVEMRAGLLEPADINISVGGVQVGGVVAWMQRQISNPRTLVLTIYERKNGVQVSGSLHALGMSDEGMRIDIPLDGAENDVPMDMVVEQAAYEIIRRRLALDSSNKVEVLSGNEFQTLVEVLRDTAALNRRVALGRGALPEFQELLGKVSRLADEVPDWYQLNYLAGSVAESAKDLEAASKHYTRVVSVITKDSSQPAMRDRLNARLAELKTQTEAAAPPTDAAGSGSPAKRAREKIEAYAQTATSILNGLLGHQLPSPRVKVTSGEGQESWVSYWDGRQVVVPPAAADLPDIVYREASWPHIMRIAGSGALDGDDGSTEAILYSYADIFPMLIQQSVLKQDEKSSSWELAPGWLEMFNGKDLAAAKTKTPYLSFAALGTKAHASAMGATNQVAHMRDFDTKSDPMQRKYINSGILNKAFYEAARRLGTAKASDIWIGALKQLKTVRKVDFPRFAVLLNDAAGEADRVQLREALLAVGLDPQSRSSRTR
jgi:hypothetical protein